MATVWNPADKTANMLLSNSNHTGTLNGITFTNEGVRATGVTHDFGSGKFYLEFSSILSGSGAGRYGVANFTDALASGGSGMGVDPGAVLHGGSVTSSISAGSPDGHTLGIAMDFVNEFIWVTYDGTTWFGGTTGATPDPASTTNGLSISTAVGPFIPWLWEQSFAAGHATLNCGDNAFVHTVPAGFVGWDAPTPPPPRFYASFIG